MPLITVDIIPDSTVINLFNNEDTSPIDTFNLTGVVEITAEGPVQIRQIQIQLKGQIQSIVSLADMNEDNSLMERRYEIPLNQWDTLEYLSSNVFNRMSRKLLEFSYAYTSLINQCTTILDESQFLKTGKNQFPFSIEIPNVNLLPPTLILPQHSIKYKLFAKIKPSSLGERLKVTYWNARVNPLRKINTQLAIVQNSQRSRSQAEPISTHTLFDGQQTQTYSDNYQENDSPNNVEHSRRDLLFSQLLSHKRQSSLSASRAIQICQHSYPTLINQSRTSRVRYHGCRQGRLKYRVTMPKFACFQHSMYKFQCRFESLCEEATIKNIGYYIEQSESYPVRAGNFQPDADGFEDLIAPRKRKYSLAEQNMQDYVNGQSINFSMSLDIPHISQTIKSPTLKITHKLRLNIRFMDSTKERAMSLSFPLVIVTIPRTETSTSNPGRDAVDNYLDTNTLYTYSDPLLLTYEEPTQVAHFNEDEYNILPSYLEALNEGAPPSPFLEDNI